MFTALFMAGSKNVSSHLLAEARTNKANIGFLLAFMVISFSAYLLLDRILAIRLAAEDSLFEYVTAACFFGTAVLLVRSFSIKRNFFFLALALVFFVGCGEEISWGQRIFGFGTPESIAQKNIQGETNLHNLDVFHPQDEAGQSKSGLAKLITVDFLYNLFWLGWCIVIPFVVLFDWMPARLLNSIRVPVPALSIGLLFLTNFCAYIIIRSTLSVSNGDLYYMKLREVFECVSALIFFFVGYSLLIKEKLPQP
jgi:hypothetical protein